MGNMELEEAVKRDLRTKKEQVADILERFPASRNSDTYMMILWLREYGDLSVRLPFIPWEDIEKINFESLTRARRLLNQDGQYLPTDPRVLERRMRQAEAYRKAIPHV